MKVKLFIIPLLTALLISFIPVKIHAADVTIGAATWYSWWDFEPKDSPDKFEFDPALLYGPVIAVKLSNDFTLNSVFLYGEFEGDYKVDFGGATGWQTFTSKTERYDSDTSLSYRLNDYFKIFGGFKYAGYKFTVDSVNALPAYYLPDIEVKNLMYGPAAGLSGIFPLADNFYIIANGSGMYLFGKSENSATRNADIRCYGYNTTASIAYYIPSASVTLSLGGRYQHIKLDAVNNNGTDANHKFSGITAAATYSFSM